MRWEDERYVRLYTRDTVTWKMLPWQAKCVLPLLLRKLDRAGVLDCESSVDPAEAVSVLIEVPVDVVRVGLDALRERGVFAVSGVGLLMPKFMEAQEATQTDKQRKAEQRARARDKANSEPPRFAQVSQPVTGSHERSQPVTARHGVSQVVTSGHAASQPVTPSLAVPCLAEPSRAVPNQPTREKPRGGVGELQDRMEAAFLEIKKAKMLWRTDFEHEGALRKLTGVNDDEIVRRWRIALVTPYPLCASLKALVENWDYYATPPPGKAKDPRTGTTWANDDDWKDGDGGYAAANKKEPTRG